MIFKDYYKILGIETNKVNLDDIKSAYREQAKKYHPDVNVGNTNAEERFKDINEAYNVLSNPTTKKKYDKDWNYRIGRKKTTTASKNNNKTSTKSEVFSILFGNKDNILKKNENNKSDKNPIQGENVETEIGVSLQEAFNGENKKISLKTVNGKMKTFDIKIPEGIRNNEKIRLVGQGKPGLNGGRSGDLLIRTIIESSKGYKLVGCDINKNVNITPWEAALGAKIEVESIDGLLSVYIPKGTNSDEIVTIPQKGYKDGKGGRGNLNLIIKIMVQKGINEEEKELYKKLKEISKFNPR